MMNRIVALFGAFLMVCASPFSSAWDAQSFVADSPDYYTMFPSDFSSSNSVLDDSFSGSGSVKSLDFDALFDNGIWLCNGFAFWTHCYNPGYDGGIPETQVPPYEFDIIDPVDGLSFSFTTGNVRNKYWTTESYSIPDKLYGSEVRQVWVPGFSNAVNDPSSVEHYQCDFQFDISSLGSFSAFEISGYLQMIPMLLNSSGSLLSQGYLESIGLIVNGDEVSSWVMDSNAIDFTIPSTLISRSSDIDSVALRFSFVPSSPISYDSSVSYRIRMYSYRPDNSSGNLSLTALTSDEALNGYNDEAQDSINSHEQVESEWVQTSSDNFAALDIENFSIPSSLLSGFALISGIFTDIWNGLGDYRVVFVLPLTLGVILVVVGRIARTAGSQSSRNKGGDGNA